MNLFINDERLHDMKHIFSKYPHVSLLISNFDLFLDSYPHDNRIKDLFDHIVLRLFTDTKCRTHFPIVLESNKSRFFNRVIWQMLHQSEEYFPTIELLGYNLDDIPNNLSEIFNYHQLNVLTRTLGGNPGDWHGVTKYFLTYFDNLNILLIFVINF